MEGPPKRPALRLLEKQAQLLLAAQLALAALALGGVHRPTLLILSVLGALACSLSTLASALRRRSSIEGWLLAPWISLAIIPALQLVPLPIGVRSFIDPVGTDLLSNRPGGTPAYWPISLDPPATASELLRAGLALAAAILAANAALRRPPLGRRLLSVLALTAVASAIVGLLHKTLGIERVYGRYATPSPILIGPFISANHLAEFLTLGAFAAFALTHRKPGFPRLAWAAVAAFIGASALLTVSRGVVIGLGAGVLVYFALLLRRPGEAETNPLHSWAPRALKPLLLVGSVLLLGAYFGAGALLDELRGSTLTTPETKLLVWRDSLSVLRSHPFGIGRGAFASLYPVHKTLSVPGRFDFVENLPLQLLLDTGWLGFSTFAAVTAISLFKLRRIAALGPTELSLVAGLCALLAHNLVDFGFEIPGVRLPAAVIFGVLVGTLANRHPETHAASASRKPNLLALASIVLGAGLAISPVGADYDAQIRENPQSRAALARVAALYHPVDYYFPLVESASATLLPLAKGAPSPQLAALNRALRLCIGCADVHLHVAQTLWLLTARSQALLEYGQAVQLEPERLRPVLEELKQRGAPLAAIASLPVTSGANALLMAEFLARNGAQDLAGRTLDKARAFRAPLEEQLYVAGLIQSMSGDLKAALHTLDEAQRQGAASPKIYELVADLQTRAGDLGAALASVEQGLRIDAFHIPLARKSVLLSTQLDRRASFEKVVQRYRDALTAAGGTTWNASFLAAQAYARWEMWREAIRNFRAALAISADSPEVWYQLGTAQQRQGDFSSALQSFREVQRLAPGYKNVSATIRDLVSASVNLELGSP